MLTCTCGTETESIGWVVNGPLGRHHKGQRASGSPRLSEISYIYDPLIYDITSGCRVAALFSRDAERWTPNTIWFPRYFYPQANGIMYLERREC